MDLSSLMGRYHLTGLRQHGWSGLIIEKNHFVVNLMIKQNFEQHQLDRIIMMAWEDRRADAIGPVRQDRAGDQDHEKGT